jgi:TIGR00159 family protein
MRQALTQFFSQYMTKWYFPTIEIIDILEILIISFVVYHIMLWIKNTKAWMLMKGIGVLGIFILVAALLRMDTILWLAKNMVSVLAMAAIVVFQPELRRALEKLGEKQFLASMVSFDNGRDKERFTQKTIDAIVEATFAMGKTRTGALIVIERVMKLAEYASTGIGLDAEISGQLLISIFEHNTPLHDGAIIIRENRIIAATCYLPLSDNMNLSKELGTRHRAALGMSEVSDALVIVVSEESGVVSAASGGQLARNISEKELRERLAYLQDKNVEMGRLSAWWKGRQKNERKASKKSSS